MGKKSRLKRERRENPTFKITIGATIPGSESDGDIHRNVAHQSRLIKAALLYADEVTLCSPTIAVMLAYSKLPQFSIQQKIEVLSLAAPSLAYDGNILAQMLQMQELGARFDFLTSNTISARQAMSRLSQSDRAAVFAFKAEKDRLTQGIESQFHDMSANARIHTKEWGLDALQDLIGKGKVRVINLGPPISDVEIIASTVQSAVRSQQDLYTEPASSVSLRMNEDDYKKTLFGDLMNQFQAMINSPTEYPLFDYEAAHLVEVGLREGVFESTALQNERVKHTALTANFLERLPLFDEASASELLSIRSALKGPLVRFRQAMMKYSSEMEANPWSADFQLEADRVFHSEIEPIVLSLEEEIRSNNYLL
ncbi:MAG: hypothetical protein EOP10_24585, partial [Proteobacteria bacterium]